MRKRLLGLHVSIEVQPDLAEAHFNLALCLEALGDAKQAIAEFQKAIRYNPYVPRSFVRLGKILVAEGRDMEAVSPLKDALNLEPEQANRLRNYCKALRRDSARQSRASLGMMSGHGCGWRNR